MRAGDAEMTTIYLLMMFDIPTKEYVESFTSFIDEALYNNEGATVETCNYDDAHHPYFWVIIDGTDEVKYKAVKKLKGCIEALTDQDIDVHVESATKNNEEHYASKYLNMPISSDKEWARLVKQFEGSEDDCLIFNSKGRGETYGKE
jgi:hypothetical protein